MNLTATIIKNLLKRKIATAVLITVSVAAFAALGDGGKRGQLGSSNALTLSSKTFNLRSGYNYKSNNLLNNRNDSKFIMLNTVVTFQKGNATYILPLKKKVLLGKIIFNPAPLKF